MGRVLLSGAIACAVITTSAIAAPLHVGYDADHLDLDRHVLQFKPSRAVTEATLSVITDDGQTLDPHTVSYDHPAAGAWQAIDWTQPEGSRVMKLQLRVVAADGVATKLELIPWSVAVDHDDVNFRTDSSAIDDAERAKLDASYDKIDALAKRAGQFMKVTLYIAGHTDTVGAAAKNRTLSLDRAIAIGRYFAKRGLAVPIVVAGFGEDVLKVATPDDTDERANRRADYVLGPTGAMPPFRGAYLKAKTQWRPLH